MDARPFNDCGALVGKVVSADPQTGASTLTHTAVFDFRNMFVTKNDQAQITTRHWPSMTRARPVRSA